ncbi:hypothetical protein F5Y04DRAFT_264181 [Hypomontagnella monticulosa]|nr:hypothetical protein F5Y04DRAFT_264181 [Hypomontagnella monticulosa]
MFTPVCKFYVCYPSYFIFFSFFSGDFLGRRVRPEGRSRKRDLTSTDIVKSLLMGLCGWRCLLIIHASAILALICGR